MRKIFGPKGDEVAGRRKIPIEELHDLPSSSKNYWNDKLVENGLGGM
jgi:hypothetical protein